MSQVKNWFHNARKGMKIHNYRDNDGADSSQQLDIDNNNLQHQLTATQENQMATAISNKVERSN